MKLRNFCPNMFHMSRRTIYPCRAIDRAQEPRIPPPCSLKTITHATGSKIGSSQSRWNRGTEYYPVGMKSHIEGLIYFFENIIVRTTLKWAPTFSSIYYEHVALLHPPNRLASDKTEEFLIFAQTCSTCLEGPYRNDSSSAHSRRAIDRAWEPQILMLQDPISGVLGAVEIGAQNTTL